MAGDYRLIPASADPATRLALRMADLDSRLSRIELRGKGVIIDNFQQYGANAAWTLSAGSGQGVYVDAAQAIPLRWQYTPPMDVWVEVHGTTLAWNAGAATWNYFTLQSSCSPTPAVAPGTGDPAVRVYDHNGAAGGGVSAVLTVIYGLTGGTTYNLGWSMSNTGGNIFNYFQGSQWTKMMGKAWPR